MRKEKKCKKCGKPVLLEDFSKRPWAKDGRDSSCKKCINLKAKLKYKNARPQW